MINNNYISDYIPNANAFYHTASPHLSLHKSLLQLHKLVNTEPMKIIPGAHIF